MLVLRRNRGQSIVIDANIKITVKILREENGVVTLGIDAPKSVTVDREEIYLKRQANDQPIKTINMIPQTEECLYVSA